MADWQELTQMTRGEPIRIERVRLPRTNVRIEGDFELPPLARLTFEEQVFVAAFVRCHGSIKEMESSFGISYPTVKNRLNKIAGQLGFVAAQPAADADNTDKLPASPVPPPQTTRLAVLEQLARGEISADAAVEQIKKV